MKQEIKDPSGKVLFTAEVAGNRLNINSATGQKVCCIEHDGEKLQIKDDQDQVLQELPKGNQ